MSVLVDTSCWIDYFRNRTPTADELADLLADHAVVLCGPVLAELLAGAPEQQRDALRDALAGLPFVDIDYSTWREAGELSQTLRRAGVAIPLLDVLIALAAIRAKVSLWTRDRDFERVAELIPALRLHPQA